MNRFLRTASGAAFIEFAAVFPVLLMLIMGTMDFSVLALKWVSLSKASYAGARLATVIDPVAIGVNAKTPGTVAGASCFDFDSGVATGACDMNAATVCTGAATGGSCCPVGATPGSCTSNYQWNEASFAAVLAEMNKYMLTESLERGQLQISYQPTDFGFAQRPVGPPMTITVSVRCVTYPFYLLAPLMKWVFSTMPASCAGIHGTGMSMPSFPTSLPSEDLATND